MGRENVRSRPVEEHVPTHDRPAQTPSGPRFKRLLADRFLRAAVHHTSARNPTLPILSGHIDRQHLRRRDR